MEVLAPLTTPVSYLSSIPRNPFHAPDLVAYMADVWQYSYNYKYTAEDGFESELQFIPPGVSKERRAQWALGSVGPDNQPNKGHMLAFNADYAHQRGWIYDGTNGTKSRGDIVRIGP